MTAVSATEVVLAHPTLGRFRFAVDAAARRRRRPELLFTENETNAERLFGAPNRAALRARTPSTTTSCDGDVDAVNPRR